MGSRGRLVLDSEHLSWMMAKSGRLHVRDVEQERYAHQTLCGQKAETLREWGGGMQSTAHMCARCMASLQSEQRWSGFGVKPARYQRRWHMEEGGGDGQQR